VYRNANNAGANQSKFNPAAVLVPSGFRGFFLFLCLVYIPGENNI